MKHRVCLVIALVSVVSPPGGAAGGALAPSEARVVRSVDRHTDDAFALLRRAVDMNSGTMNAAGVRAAGDVFARELEALGFRTRWIDGTAWGRAGHLVAERNRAARGVTRVLLIGHLDTVFEPSSPFQRYEQLTDSTARGPGVLDMKGGNVIMLLALRALLDAHVLDRLAIAVVLSGDEEKAGTPHALSRRDLRDAAEWADVAIGFEDGDGDPAHAVTARRGASAWMLAVHGTPAHSSQILRSDIGHGAVYEAARILSAFRDSLSREAYLTVNPGAIVGGTTVTYDAAASSGTAFGKSNVVAESTIVMGDLRTISRAQRERAMDTMRRIVAAGTPHTSATISFDDGYPPLSPSHGNARLLAVYDRASRDLGLGGVTAVDPARAGAADISFTEGLVDAAIDGIGMRGDGGHTVQETARLRWLAPQAKRIAVTLARLATAAR